MKHNRIVKIAIALFLFTTYACIDDDASIEYEFKEKSEIKLENNFVGDSIHINNTSESQDVEVDPPSKGVE